MYPKTIESSLLLSAYLPNIHYFTKLVTSKLITIEQQDNFVKQTYRNRCNVLTADGCRSLTIPINRVSGKFKTKDATIDYSTNWQHLHWKTILASYGSSPFFEYYQDDFFPFFHSNIKYLIDFNTQLLDIAINLIGFNPNIKFTEEYVPDSCFKAHNYREQISPKNQISDQLFSQKKYYQVFTQDGFIPNLSIIDLLFNEGNNSLAILLDSVKK